MFPPPWPAICLFHGGGWAHGNRSWIDPVGKDLALHGIIGLCCDYELTIDLLPGQSAPVRWPNQHPDCVLAVNAARNPDATSQLFGKTNGKVGVLGGSAGATLAIDCVLKTEMKDRADCACALSGNYDFSDQASLDQYEHQPGWSNEVFQYNDVPNRTYTDKLLAQSVVTVVPTVTRIPPIYLIQSQGDAIGPPTSQLPQMTTALDAIGFTNYTAYIVPGSEHAQRNWQIVNPVTGNTVGADVISFFKKTFAMKLPPKVENLKCIKK